MKALIEAGIEDLGGTGELILEIEYNNSASEFKEVFYRLPAECNKWDIVNAMLLHAKTHSTLVLKFNSIEPFKIPLSDICDKLIEVRLPDAAGGTNITHIFSEML